MPTEKKPTQPKAIEITKGNRHYKIDPEIIRQREGTVDANGTRTITLFKSGEDEALVAQQLNWYRANGYDIKEDKFEYQCSIRNTEFKKREAAQHDKALHALKAKKPMKVINEGYVEELQHLDPNSPSNVSSLIDTE